MRYDYHCDKCGTFEVIQSIHDDSLTSCPECNGPVERIVSGGLYYFDSTPKTLGSLSEKNTIKHKTKVEDLEKKESVKRPWWRDDKPDRHLGKMTPQETKKYIETGYKPHGLNKRV